MNNRHIHCIYIHQNINMMKVITKILHQIVLVAIGEAPPHGRSLKTGAYKVEHFE